MTVVALAPENVHTSGPRLWQRGRRGDIGDGMQARGRTGKGNVAFAEDLGQSHMWHMLRAFHPPGMFPLATSHLIAQAIFQA